MFKKLNIFLNKVLFKLGFKNSVYYINGPETLPAPFTAEEEADLLKNFHSNNSYVKEKLIVHNLRLVVYIARKFDSNNSTVEDLISIGTIGLIKAVNTFCPEKNIKLATYASRCIENEILMYLRKNSAIKTEISIDEPLNIDWDGNELLLSDILGSDGEDINKSIEFDDEKNLLLNLINDLPKREKEIIEMRFGLKGFAELTQKQVADTLGISQSYISRLEKRIINKLKKQFEKVI
ncbi:MAG: RNA polymerase sporulation sigma factor SigE [Clostridia bacterium]|nr:RNA polymerase sporulation sigma factor SigE [Clostridia bacterium]